MAQAATGGRPNRLVAGLHKVGAYGRYLRVLLAGTIFTERNFGIQGIGWWALQAVYGRDLPVVSATALFSAVFSVFSFALLFYYDARLTIVCLTGAPLTIKAVKAASTARMQRCRAVPRSTARPSCHAVTSGA